MTGTTGVLAEVGRGALEVVRRLEVVVRGRPLVAEQAMVEIRVAMLGRWMTVETRVTVATTL